jgi:hypothetical protein
MYTCKELKEAKPDADFNKVYFRLFGHKTIGANFEKMIKRIYKHLTKDYWLFTNIVAKLKTGL